MPPDRWFAVGTADVSADGAGGRAADAALIHDGAKLLIVFCSPTENIPDLIGQIRSRSGDVPLIGCTTAGEIARNGPCDGSVVVAALGGGRLRHRHRLFGFTEVRTTAGIVAGVIEVAAFAALAGLAAMSAERGQGGGGLLASLRAGVPGHGRVIAASVAVVSVVALAVLGGSGGNGGGSPMRGRTSGDRPAGLRREDPGTHRGRAIPARISGNLRHVLGAGHG